ncbi:unnamed protein product, partial [Larinioides sclopetarius]
MDWYDDNEVNQLDWPIQGPDLYLIGNLWNELDCRIKGYNNRPKSVKELACLLQAEWNKILLSIIQTLMNSMPRRVKA